MRQASYKSNVKTTCRTRHPALPHIVIPAKAGIQRGVAPGVSSPFAPPTPVVGALPESVRPEPVEACPEDTRRACPEGTRRGPSATSNPRITPHTPTPCAARHPDTSSLPQRRRPRYHPRMEAQTTDAIARIEVFVAQSSRATSNARLARQEWGLFRQRKWSCSCDESRPLQNHYRTIATGPAELRTFVARSFRATGNARLARQVRGLFRQKKWICSCDVSRPLRNHYKTIAIAATEQRAFFARSSRATGNARLARQVRGLFRQKKWICSCDRSRPLRNHYKTIAIAATEQRAFFDGAMGAPGPTRGGGRPPTPPRSSPRASPQCARRPHRPSCRRPTGNSSATARPASPRRRTARGWAGPSCG